MKPGSTQNCIFYLGICLSSIYLSVYLSIFGISINIQKEKLQNEGGSYLEMRVGNVLSVLVTIYFLNWVMGIRMLMLVIILLIAHC